MAYFYIQLDENDITVVRSMRSEEAIIKDDKIIPITKELYDDRNILGKYYNRQTGEFE